MQCSKDKQRSTKHYTETKEWATQTPMKTGGELRCSGRVSSSCSTCGTCHVTLVTNPVISHEWGKDRIVISTNEAYNNVMWIFDNVCKDTCESCWFVLFDCFFFFELINFSYHYYFASCLVETHRSNCPFNAVLLFVCFD